MKKKTIVARLPASKKTKPAKTIPLTNKKVYTELAIILSLCVVAYIPVFTAGFVNWDDPDYVNQQFLKQARSNLGNWFTTPIQGNYHPLTVLSLALNYAISGTKAWSYHVLNLLLHLINCILVFRLILLLAKGNKLIAFVTAALFALHPMHVESVAWVSERKDVLYGLFFIAGLISYTKYIDSKKRKHFALTLLFFVLSLLSKPAAVIFPLVLFCIDFLRKRQMTAGLFIEKIPFFLLSLTLGVITYLGQREIAVDIHGSFDGVTRLLMGLYGIMMYVIKMILPFRLSPFYPFPPNNVPLPPAYHIAPIFTLALAGLCIYWWKKNRIVAFGILFYVTNLLLVLQFLPVGSAVIADRYTYIPYLGLFFVGGVLINRFVKSNTKLGYAIVIPLAIILALLSYNQSAVWKTSATLWDHAIAVNPNFRAYINRAMAFDEEKNFDKAIEYYSKGLQLNPAEKDAYIFRGKIYYNTNRPDLAYQDFKKALALDSNYYPAMDNLGVFYLGRKQCDSAILNFDHALQLKADYFSSYRNRALSFMELKRFDDAIRDFKKFLEFQPNDPDIYNAVGACYRLSGKPREAITVIDKALAIKQDPHFYLNRAYCYGGLKNDAQAKKDAAIAKQAGLILDQTFAQQLGIPN